MGGPPAGFFEVPANSSKASTLAIQAESKDEAERLFQALSAGGKVGMPLTDVPWGAYFGMFTDKFGMQWMVNCDRKK